ncbi:MAG: transcriptional regulator [Geobacteraceae bacterium GWB2_52_12]|nr:MAG: transcriptional regulator [Geobacteraceae bacterium GWB2_52_12]
MTTAILSSKEIGWKLRKLRLQAGWAQERLAEKIGVSVQQIQNYESGANKMNTDRLQQAAQALDVPIQLFFTDTDETLPMAVEEKLLLDSYRAIPNKEIQESILKITTNASRQCK